MPISFANICRNLSTTTRLTRHKLKFWRAYKAEFLVPARTDVLQQATTTTLNNWLWHYRKKGLNTIAVLRAAPGISIKELKGMIWGPGRSSPQKGQGWSPRPQKLKLYHYAHTWCKHIVQTYKPLNGVSKRTVYGLSMATPSIYETHLTARIPRVPKVMVGVWTPKSSLPSAADCTGKMP